MEMINAIQSMGNINLKVLLILIVFAKVFGVSHATEILNLKLPRHSSLGTSSIQKLGGRNTILDSAAVERSSRNSVDALKGDSGRVPSKIDTNTSARGVGEILAPKSFPMNQQEPTCEELRAMWIFSKRQSRAAEITNEIPTYRDPFSFNVWEPYYTSSYNIPTLRAATRYNDRLGSPVFGRVVSREPLAPYRTNSRQRQRFVGGSNDAMMPRMYVGEAKPTINNSRRPPHYRHVGANNSNGSGGSQNSVPVQGSFQKLKELIWTERAKELTQQRRAEELAARAAVLKEISNGQNVQHSYKPPSKSESVLMDENRSPDQDTMNDDYRTMRVASSQSQSNENNGDKINSILRSMSQNSRKIFNKGTLGHLPNRNSMDEKSRERSFAGVPKAYPIRPSHFRERNRVLFKQTPPSQFFQREVRRKISPADEIQDLEVDTLLVNDLQNGFEPYDERSYPSYREPPMYSEDFSALAEPPKINYLRPSNVDEYFEAQHNSEAIRDMISSLFDENSELSSDDTFSKNN